jgi:hypothetical protein
MAKAKKSKKKTSVAKRAAGKAPMKKAAAKMP